MWTFIVLIFVAVSSVFAGYSGSASTSQSNNVSGPPGTGQSSTSHDGGAGSLPNPSNFNFEQFFQKYFESLKKYNEEFQTSQPTALSYSHAFNNPYSEARAESSLTFKKGLQQNYQNAAGGYGFPGGFPAFAGFPQFPNFPGFPQGAPGGFGQGGAGGFGQGAGGSYGQGGVPQGGYGGSYGGSFGGPGSGGAAASASLGPQGVHQTAGVYPQNPSSPNIDTRFGGESGAPSGGGYYGVQTSSFSGSSNVDGKPTSFHQASTTVNDNGKVSTYTVRNP